MLNHFLNRTWVQYVILGGILGISVYYFGFVFHFDYQFHWDVLYTETEYGNMGELLLNGINLTITISKNPPAASQGYVASSGTRKRWGKCCERPSSSANSVNFTWQRSGE